MPKQPYATVEALTERLGYEHPDAARLLADASDDLDSIIRRRFTVDPATGLPVTDWIAETLATACLRQVEFLIEVGPEHGTTAPPRNGSVQTPKWSQTWQPGRFGPRVLDVMNTAGLLVSR